MAYAAIIVIELTFLGAAGVAFYMRENQSNSDSERTGYLVGGCVMIAVFLIFNMIICCLWKSVKVAIAVIDATADFFAATKRIIFVSVLNFIIMLIVVIVWFAGLACVASLNDISSNPNIIQGKTILWKSQVKWMSFFMIFGVIWLLIFIQNITGFICMVSAGTYYFTSNHEKEGSASVMTGFKFAYFKHSGSLAFGSLIHTIVYIIRMIVEHAAD